MISLTFVSLLLAAVVRTSPFDADQIALRSFAASTSPTYDESFESIYEVVHHASLTDYALRITSPEPSLCDPSVEQHAGFFDISDEKHLFFWFFESRKAPEKAPLTLWMNGGPGGSSSVGMLFELGPCNIANEGKNTTVNPYSWNTYSNMIFLDQPVNVGFSYASEGASVDNSPVAAEDVYAFLQLFLAKYPKYASAPFHIAAESYGGTYGPHVASAIHRKNKEVPSVAPSLDGSASTQSRLQHINLASLILANGHTDPKIQFAAVPEYVCDGPYAFLESDDPQCVAWKKKLPTCQRLVQTCYDFDTPLTCTPADLYCWSQIWIPLTNLGKNIHDVRKSCDPAEGNCYPEFDWIETWLNSSATKKAIGIDPSLKFQLINADVGAAFHARGDAVRDSATLLPELVEDGVRLLVYAGMADLACNFIGNEAWVTKMDNKFRDEFGRSPHLPWTTIESRSKAGEVRYAGGGGETAGNVTFVQIFEAGHMVPYDQPDAALDLFTRWILDVPLYFPNSSFTSLEELLK